MVVPAAPQNLIFIKEKDRGLGTEREGGSFVGVKGKGFCGMRQVCRSGRESSV